MAKSNSFTDRSETIGHVILNVTGDGLESPILWTWDSHDGTKDFPSEINIPDVPRGSKLIQLLVVYMTDSSGMTFTYGEQGLVATLTDHSVAIGLADLGTSATTSGRISGRYLTTKEDLGPSGQIKIVYTPPSKKPLLIETATIVNGWFSVFALSSIELSYLLPDGSEMFNGPVALNSKHFPTSVNTDNLLRYSIPDHYRTNDGTTWDSEEAQWGVYGWFSSEADLIAKKAVCTIGLDILTANNGSPKILRSPPSSIGATSSTRLATFGLNFADDPFGSATDLGTIYLSGGLDETSNSTKCNNSDNQFTSLLPFNGWQMNGYGNDTLARIVGPLKYTYQTGSGSSNPQAFLFTTSRSAGSARELSFSMLPNTKVTQATVYASGSAIYDSQHFSCADLNTGKVSGFTKVFAGEIPAADGGTGVTTLKLNTEISLENGGMICFAQGGFILDNAIQIPSWVFQNN